MAITCSRWTMRCSSAMGTADGDTHLKESFHSLMVQMIGVHAIQDQRFREVYETKPLQILGILLFGYVRA